MNTDKYISNIKEKVNKKIEALRKEADEAYRSWADTGYQRYITKKEKLESEADKLEAFIRPDINERYLLEKIKKLENKNENLRMLLKSVQTVVEMDMLYSFPDCRETRRLEEIVKEFKFEKGGAYGD